MVDDTKNLEPNESESSNTTLLAQRYTGVETASVSVTLSMKRNLGNYEDCHISVRYEQRCLPEDKKQLTEELDALAIEYVTQKNKKIDAYIKSKEKK